MGKVVSNISHPRNGDLPNELYYDEVVVVGWRGSIFREGLFMSRSIYLK